MPTAMALARSQQRRANPKVAMVAGEKRAWYSGLGLFVPLQLVKSSEFFVLCLDCVVY